MIYFYQVLTFALLAYVYMRVEKSIDIADLNVARRNLRIEKDDAKHAAFERRIKILEVAMKVKMNARGVPMGEPSLDPPEDDDMLECEQCGAWFYEADEYCPMCGLKGFEDEKENN